MDFKIEIEDNKYIRKFFKHNEKYKKFIIDNIHNVLPVLIEEKPYKIKRAHGYKYKDKVIYEYKIKLDKYTNCRVAYTTQNSCIVIFFISNIIIKKDFVNLVKDLDYVK